MRTSFAAAAACAFALAASGAQAAQLITNGDFETGDLSGWAITGMMGVGTAAIYNPCCGVSGGPPGNHFAAFGWGNETGVHSISQTLITQIGSLYSLTFDAGALGSGSQLLVTTAGGVTNAYSLTANNNLNSTFTNYGFNFVGTGSDKVTFAVTTSPDNIDAVVDNVSVQGAVPEPATWAMMLMGFGGLGAVLRRRRGLAPVAA